MIRAVNHLLYFFIIIIVVVVVFLCFLCSNKHQMVRIFISSVLPHPISAVWSLIRDFNGMPTWHPAIKDSTIEDGLKPDQVGCVRSFHLQSGENMRERLLEISDLHHTQVYTILHSSMPIKNYVGKLRLLEVTDGDSTFVEWTAEFECDQKEAINAVVEAVGKGVFLAGIHAMGEYLKKGTK